MKRLAIFLLLAAPWAPSSPARGQPAPDAPPEAPSQDPATAAPRPATGWEAAVDRFADALAMGDADALLDQLTADAVLYRLEKQQGATIQDLARLRGGASVIGRHAYASTPANLAAHVCADVNAADAIADEDKQRLVPPDEEQLRKANEVAGAWLEEVMPAPKSGPHPLGVIVLWRPPPAGATPDDPAARGRLLFVLLRGQQATAAYTVREVRFGDPLASP